MVAVGVVTLEVVVVFLEVVRVVVDSVAVRLIAQRKPPMDVALDLFREYHVPKRPTTSAKFEVDSDASGGSPGSQLQVAVELFVHLVLL